MNELAKKKCVPCEGGMKPLSREEAEKLLKKLNDWMLIDEAKMLAKTFQFKDFVETMRFVNKIAEIAQGEGHHPDMSVSYNTLGVELTTHAINGLSENDFIVASKIDLIEK